MLRKNQRLNTYASNETELNIVTWYSTAHQQNSAWKRLFTDSDHKM